MTGRSIKPRSFHRLAKLWSWLCRRERQAWDRLQESGSTTDAARSARWTRLMHATQACPRKAEA